MLDVFGNTVYGSSLEEMDSLYPRCEKTDCKPMFHACLHCLVLADSDKTDSTAAWCTRKEEE